MHSFLSIQLCHDLIDNDSDVGTIARKLRPREIGGPPTSCDKADLSHDHVFLLYNITEGGDYCIYATLPVS